MLGQLSAPRTLQIIVIEVVSRLPPRSRLAGAVSRVASSRPCAPAPWPASPANRTRSQLEQQSGSALLHGLPHSAAAARRRPSVQVPHSLIMSGRVLICATSATKLLDGRETGCWCGSGEALAAGGAHAAGRGTWSAARPLPKCSGALQPPTRSACVTLAFLFRRVEEVATPYLLWREKGFEVRPALASCRTDPVAPVRRQSCISEDAAAHPPAAQVDLCSVKGGAIPWDAASCQEGSDFFTPEAQSFYKDGARGGHAAPGLLPSAAQSEGHSPCAHRLPPQPSCCLCAPAAKLAEAWKNTKSIEQVLGGDIEHYDALFVSQGEMWQGGRLVRGMKAACIWQMQHLINVDPMGRPAQVNGPVPAEPGPTPLLADPWWPWHLLRRHEQRCVVGCCSGMCAWLSEATYELTNTTLPAHLQR